MVRPPCRRLSLDKGRMAKYNGIRLRLVGEGEKSPAPAPYTSEWPLRPGSFCLSILVHAGVVCALFYLPAGAIRSEKRFHAAVYKVIPLKKEPIIYWAAVPKELPSVSPETPIGGSTTFQGEERSATEKIVVQQPNAETAKQLVWQPEKPTRLKTETPSPNMVAVQGRAVPKPFTPPAARPQVQESAKVLSSAPELQATNTVLPVNAAGLPALPNAKPKPKAFVAPKEQPKLVLSPGLLAEAPPELSGSAGRELASQTAIGTGIIPKRPAPFVPPPSRSRGNGARTGGEGAALAPPPELSAGGTGSTVTAAVIGLTAVDKLAGLPEGSRPAAFSRADKVGPPTGGTPGQGPVIPGVAIAGNTRASGSVAPLPVRPAAGTPPHSFEIRIPPTASAMSAPLRPSSRTLPRSIEARYHDRTVYVLVVPKPNLPDYVADWTMWFSERQVDAAGATSMRAPFPVRKSIPLGGTATETPGAEGWVQVAAVIGKDGKITSLNPLPGRYPAVAAKAAEDLAKWEFRPASRNGESVEVDVVIEVPFRVR
jgi:hypothetical protein